MESDTITIGSSIAIRAIFVVIFTIFWILINYHSQQKLKDKRKKKKDLRRLFLKEIIRPALYLFGLYVAEQTIQYWRFDQFHYLEIVYEMLLIVFIAGIIYNKVIKDLEELESEDHLYSLNLMVSKIYKANQSIHALSFDDYNNFFDPIGLTYFLTQVKVINHKNEKIEEDNKLQDPKKPELQAKRIIILKDKTKPQNDHLYKAITQFSNLTQDEQNLKNLIILHHISNIDLYFYPEENALKYINDVQQKKFKKITDKIRKDYDSLFIDEIGYKPTGKSGDYNFADINDEVKIVAKKIFTEISSNPEDYFIDSLTEYYNSLATGLLDIQR